MSRLYAALSPALFGALAFALQGCSDPAPTPADSSVTDVATDITDASDVTTDVATDVAVDVTDASADVTDAAADASASFVSMTTLTTLTQNCMPAVPADPMSIRGTIAVTNTGTIPIGPITITQGLITRLLGGDVMANFAVTPVTIPAIEPGRSATAMFEKTNGSLANDAGTMGCNIVPCDSPIRVQLILTGTNIPEGTRAASEPGTLPCTH